MILFSFHHSFAGCLWKWKVRKEQVTGAWEWAMFFRFGCERDEHVWCFQIMLVLRFFSSIVEECVVLGCDTESLGKQFQHFEGVYCLHLRELKGWVFLAPEDEGSMFFWYTLTAYTVTQHCVPEEQSPHSKISFISKEK